MDETQTPPETITPPTESSAPADNTGDDESPPKSPDVFPFEIAGRGLF